VTEDGSKLDAMAGQMTDLRVLVATVAGDTRAILGRLDAHDGARLDHEQRIRSLEQWRWLVTGAASVGGGLIGAALSSALQLGK
jgi:hypothetical protein